MGGGVNQMLTLAYRGEGGVMDRPKMAYVIYEQPLNNTTVLVALGNKGSHIRIMKKLRNVSK